MLLITNKANIRYLSGFNGTSGYIVLDGNRKFLFTDARYHLVAASVLPSSYKIIDITGGFKTAWQEFLKKYRVKHIEVEASDVSLNFYRFIKKTSKGVKISDMGSEIADQRMQKKKDELEKISKAQQITDTIFGELKKWIRTGMSEQEIAWQVEVFAHQLGAEDISFPAIIAFNQNSAAPHHQPTNKKLKKGDLILIDMGVTYKGYCSDMTRMLFTKKPTAEEEKVYSLVLEAQETALRKLKAGVKGEQADTWAREVITKAGFGKQFGHSLGHGVGLEVHELPNLSQKYSGKLPLNTVVTVEPGIYIPGKFGVRLEDMAIVHKKNAANMTKSPKSIQSSLIQLK